MGTVKFKVCCMAVYDSNLDIPDEIINDDKKILNYIREHLNECKVDNLEWLEDLNPEEAVTMEDIRYISE